MANVEWASVFFKKVTSRLPDLLTEKGEGNELAALDVLRAELGADDVAAKTAQAVELKAQLANLERGAAAEAARDAEAKQETKPRGR
jgi:type II secretory pathway component PulL